MKATLRAAICLLLASLHAQAGYVMVQSEQIEGRKAATITTKIKGGRIRIESQGGVVILDLDKGDMIMLFPRDKQFIELPGKDMKAELEKVKKAAGRHRPARQGAGACGYRQKGKSGRLQCEDLHAG